MATPTQGSDSLAHAAGSIAEPGDRQSRQADAAPQATIGDVCDAIATMADGRREGLSRLFQLTSRKVFGVCLKIVKDETVAEDMMQETYLAAWKNAQSFDVERASPITWLCAIARNKSIDHLRRHRGDVSAELDEATALVDDAPNPEAIADLSGRARRLTDCLNQLPSSTSSAIRQAFWGGLTYAELAEAVGMPLSSMKSRIRRSLASLKICMEPVQ